MEGSPLIFLDNDISKLLNKFVRNKKEDISRKYHYKLYIDYAIDCDLSFYDHYEKDFAPEEYELVIKLIKAYQSRWILKETILHNRESLSFNDIHKKYPKSSNIVKTIINNYNGVVDFHDDEWEYIAAFRSHHENCENINYYNLYFGMNECIDNREHDCMCEKCRNDRIGTNYCYYCKTGYKKLSLKDCICKVN